MRANIYRSRFTAKEAVSNRFSAHNVERAPHPDMGESETSRRSRSCTGPKDFAGDASRKPCPEERGQGAARRTPSRRQWAGQPPAPGGPTRKGIDGRDRRGWSNNQPRPPLRPQEQDGDAEQAWGFAAPLQMHVPRGAKDHTCVKAWSSSLGASELPEDHSMSGYADCAGDSWGRLALCRLWKARLLAASVTSALA